MIVIADSSPLRYLVLIREIELLPIVYGNIILPPSVVFELTQMSTPRPVRVWMEHLPDWVTVVPPRMPLTVFPSALDLGEREAISLAMELSADLLLADDGAARTEAARRKIPIQGTLGILDLAAEHGFVDFSKALNRLMQTNFRASTKLIQFFLDRDARRKR
jgi:predicted nucleic acid-binding protein